MRFSSCSSRASDALIREPVPRHFSRPIDVAQVDRHRIHHRLLQPFEVECAELFPLRHDHKRRSALDAGTGVVTEGDMDDHRPRLLHADRIVGAYLDAHNPVTR